MRPFLFSLATLLLCMGANGPARASLPVTAPADSHSTLPFFDRTYVVPERPTTRTPVTLVLQGHFPYRCGEIFDASVVDQEHVLIGLRPVPSVPPCHTPNTWAQRFPLGLFPPGRHRVQIELVVIGLPDSSSDTTRTTYYGDFAFFVAEDSIPPPPPPHQGLPYVDAVRILPAPSVRPVEGRICPDDSIVVQIAGRLPNDCFSLTSIELIRYPYPANILPPPPTVRLTVDSTGCVRRVCREAPVAWRANIVLPPLHPMEHKLPIEMAVGSCLRAEPPPAPQYRESFPFVVSRCDSLGPCVYGTFEHPNGPNACDVTIRDTARVTFAVHSSVALSGLQGEFLLHPTGLAIADMTPIGLAAGMHVSWSPARGGYRFVLFAPSGAPIPPAPWLSGASAVPVLRIALVRESGRLAPVTLVQSSALLGADVNAGPVPMCTPPPWARLDPTAYMARICRERECDFNGDGVTDVRDLVLMVRCLSTDVPCFSDTFDCNADGAFSIDDVLCCARRVLGQPRCPDCPPDTTDRPEPSIALELGAPTEAADGTLRVPLAIRGADRIGAARLALDFPTDRYDVTSIERIEVAVHWLDLHEVQAGRLVLGLIRLQPAGPSESVHLTLHLRLKPGQSPGGTVRASESEFSGPDGARLIVETGSLTQALSGQARLELSPARPNPFATETRFSITLDRAADVEVGVYDVGGRLVAPLHRGPLPLGPRELVWDGRAADGSPAGAGVYFYRAVTGTARVARKLVVLGRR